MSHKDKECDSGSMTYKSAFNFEQDYDSRIESTGPFFSLTFRDRVEGTGRGGVERKVWKGRNGREGVEGKELKGNSGREIVEGKK